MFTTDNAGKLRIGICDDSQADLERIRQAFCKSAEKLGEKDISLYLYRNGKSLCRDCQIHGFSLVFLDWEMPKLNGFDLAGKLYMEIPDERSCLCPTMKMWFLMPGNIRRCGL